MIILCGSICISLDIFPKAMERFSYAREQMLVFAVGFGNIMEALINDGIYSFYL